MTSAKLVEGNLRQAIDLIGKNYMSSAGVEAGKTGAKILENVYRDILLKHATKPGGQNFLNAWKAVDSKVGIYDDGNVFVVVGSGSKGGQRLAPQILWGERGTKKRKTKTTEQNRGIMPPQGWLQLAIANGLEDAKEAMRRRLVSLNPK